MWRYSSSISGFSSVSRLRNLGVLPLARRTQRDEQVSPNGFPTKELPLSGVLKSFAQQPASRVPAAPGDRGGSAFCAKPVSHAYGLTHQQQRHIVTTHN